VAGARGMIRARRGLRREHYVPGVFGPPGSLLLLGAAGLENFGVQVGSTTRKLRAITAAIGARCCAWSGRSDVIGAEYEVKAVTPLSAGRPAAGSGRPSDEFCGKQ
jgi:hypothetical protein